jgi:hypothetical protein
MKYEDLMKLDLYNSEDEITGNNVINDDEGSWDYGNKVVWTQNLCCLFDKDNTIYKITVNGDIPTSFGLKVGDTVDTINKLYGTYDYKYDYSWGEVVEYYVDSYYLDICIKDNQVSLWSISKYKNDYNGNIQSHQIPEESKPDMEADTKSDIKSDALNRMLIAIKYNDLETFKQLVLPEGIFVVRTFVSGNGARGKDIIMNVEPNKIGEDITYDVKDEIPIEMVFLFKQSCETDIKNIAEEELTDANIDLNRVSSTTDIWDFCGNAVSKLNNKEWNPHLININENKFILYEGGDVDCTGIGGWAIFEKKNDKFYLTGVFDLR